MAISSTNRYASLEVDESEVQTSTERVTAPFVPKSILKKPVKPVASAAVEKPAKEAHWGVDSMASLHISGNKALFTGLKSCEPVKIEVANSQFVTSTCRGNVYVSVKTENGQLLRIKFEKVYYHEHFSANLLSLQVLARRIRRCL